MPTYKKIDGDYTITSLNSSDNVIVNTHTFTVNGNLDVVGNITYIESTELLVDDPFITVAANNSGTVANAVFQDQGLVTQTGTGTFAGLRFNNATESWQISSDVLANGAPISAYVEIGIANESPPGGTVGDIQYKVDGITFGGNANFNFDVANSRVILNGHQVFANVVTAPGSTADSATLYHNAIGAAGTGLYVSTPPVNTELVSKVRAIAFGIIF